MIKRKGRLMVMRHADVYDNPGGDRVLYGNSPGYWLSQLGVRQSFATGHFLKGYCDLDLVVHSPLERTEQTARIVIQQNESSPTMLPDHEIRDIGVDPWQNKLLRTEWSDNRESYWKKQLSQAEKGLEHPQDIQERMVKTFLHYAEENNGKNILLVSHGDPICFLLQHYLHEQLEPLINYHMGVNKAALFEIELQPEIAVRKLYEPREYGTVYPQERP